MSYTHLTEIIKYNILEQEAIENTEVQLKRKQSNQEDDQNSSSEEPPSTTIYYDSSHNYNWEENHQISSVKSKESHKVRTRETPINNQAVLIHEELLSIDDKGEKTLTKKRKRVEEKGEEKKKYIPNLEGVFIPKMMHLNVERKKNRIQFQKNHRKTIYSFFSLAPPFNFNELFEMVLKHQETHGSDKKKSFHFIRDKSGKVHIVTFEEKRQYRAKGDLLIPK